jgi:hypothetical protein
VTQLMIITELAVGKLRRTEANSPRIRRELRN